MSFKKEFKDLLLAAILKQYYPLTNGSVDILKKTINNVIGFEHVDEKQIIKCFSDLYENKSKNVVDWNN